MTLPCIVQVTTVVHRDMSYPKADVMFSMYTVVASGTYIV